MAGITIVETNLLSISFQSFNWCMELFKLEGIIPPMVTPFKESEELDEEALRR